MKKILSFMLIALLCVSLFSCDSGDTSTETTAAITEENTVEITDAATEKETDMQTEAKTDAQSTTNDSSVGEEALLTADGYEKYLALIDELDLPDNFVYYDDISEIGEFDLLVFGYLPNGNVDYDHYVYALAIGEQHVSLYVSEGELDTFYESDQIISEINSDNLASADRSKVPNTTKSAYYFHNGMKYIYDIYGNLMTIEWYSDGFTFTLHSFTDLIESGQYPLRGEQDFLSKLLNKQTAYDTAMGILDKDTAE